MIVKITNNGGGFMVVDKVEEINYRKEVLKDGKITKVGEANCPLDNPNNVEKEIFIGGSKIYTEIIFRRANRHFRIRTDRPFYIMDDKGETIDRI